VKIFLAGEGIAELGDWSVARQYRHAPPRVGLIEALLLRLGQGPIEIGGATTWSSASKYSPRDRRANETRRVLGLAQDALESGCDALVFVRDNDRDAARRAAIERGLEEAAETNARLRLVGGLAIEEIEAWVLACCGVLRSEAVSHPKERFAELFPETDHREGKVGVIERADLDAVPVDAVSFRLWLSRARSALAG
jgi:hypothetical protein